jgi:hypothetical protein
MKQNEEASLEVAAGYQLTKQNPRWAMAVEKSAN